MPDYEEHTSTDPGQHQWVTARERTSTDPGQHQWVTARERTSTDPGTHQWVNIRERTSTDAGVRRASATNNRTDVLTTFHFYVEISGITEAAFSEISGLDAETEVTPLLEGGENTYEHRLIGRTKISDVTLKNGYTNSTELWDWYIKVIQGPPWRGPVRRNVSIIMVDQRGLRRHTWSLRDAIPVKWTGPSLNAGQSGGQVETLKLTHRGLILTATR